MKPQSVSTMLMVIGIAVPADTTRRVPGYIGVLSLPILEATNDTLSLNSRLDQILDRRDARTERGRVLYAAGHEPARSTTTPSATPAASRTARVMRACPPASSASPASSTASSPLPPPAHQTVVQGRTATSPNS
jgi:hypothetical protein